MAQNRAIVEGRFGELLVAKLLKPNTFLVYLSYADGKVSSMISKHNFYAFIDRLQKIMSVKYGYKRIELQGLDDEELEVTKYDTQYLVSLSDNGNVTMMAIDKEKLKKFIKEVMRE